MRVASLRAGAGGRGMGRGGMTSVIALQTRRRLTSRLVRTPGGVLLCLALAVLWGPKAGAQSAPVDPNQPVLRHTFRSLRTSESAPSPAKKEHVVAQPIPATPPAVAAVPADAPEPSAVAASAAAPLPEAPEVDEESPAIAQTPPEEERPAPTVRAPKSSFSSRLRVSFDYRKLGGDKDADLYGYFYGQGRNLEGGKLDLYTSLRLHTDFDAYEDDATSADPFVSLDDSSRVTENRVLQLYGDYHAVNRQLALRAGRQYIEIADYLQMDGAQLTLHEKGALGGRIYFGHPVSYYTSTSSDLAGGLSLVGSPWAGNRTRLTLARYYDESEDESDQNYYLDLRQQLSEQMRTRGQLSLLNEDFRMGRLDLFYLSGDGSTDLSMGGSYWGEFDAQTRAYSPLYRTLGESQPYTYTYARLTQLITPVFYLSPGVSLRFAESGDNDYNNRDYQNVDVAFIYQPSRSLNATIALEQWSVEEDDSFLGVTGEVRYRHRRIWELAGGVAYAEYTYDTYADIAYTSSGGQTVLTGNGTVIEESPYVRTYYVRGKWNLNRHWALRLQVDLEDDENLDDLGYRGRGSVEVRY